MNQLVPTKRRSRLLALWRLAGWLTGALPALTGRIPVYQTIAAVETFVDQHYQAQIDQLKNRPEYAELRSILMSCQQDEREHRDEALAAQGETTGWLATIWLHMVHTGSGVGVYLASRF